jgi:hypothetical protein
LGFPDMQQIKALAFMLSIKGWTIREIEYIFDMKKVTENRKLL